MDALKIHKKLSAHFGPQGWWPIFDKKIGNCKYHHNQNSCGRTSFGCDKNAFEICVGAILTQNTAWKNVEKALCNLYSSIPAKAGIQPQLILSCKNLEALIRPAGYYNQKAKKLRIFSNWWLSQPFIPAKAGISSFRQKLLSLWGIGPETADSILLYGFNKPIFVIDGYTKRLCKECGVEFKTYDEYRQFFESQLPRSAKLFNEYHALIVAWGKLHSKDVPAALKIIK